LSERYRKVAVRIWSDGKFKRLSRLAPSGQAIWIYLLTGPGTGAIPGFYTGGEAGMSEELGWRLPAFRKAFAEVAQAEMAEADWRNRLVWIPNAIRYNPPAAPNVCKSAGWRQHWNEIPECELKLEAYQFLTNFLAGMGESGDAFRDAFQEACSKPSGIRANPTPAPVLFSEGEEEVSREELEWRVREVWQAHVRAWKAFRRERDGREPKREPTFHPEDIGQPIRLALLSRERDLLGADQREQWRAESKTRAAGAGIFYDPWCAATDPKNNFAEGGHEYLEHWRPWRRQRGKADPIDRFAECYFREKERRERSDRSASRAERMQLPPTAAGGVGVRGVAPLPTHEGLPLALGAGPVAGGGQEP
jgi:hypothetical protein